MIGVLGLEANRAYFDLKMEGKLDNPDQRICEDVASFVRNSVEMMALVGSKVLNICAFTGVLWWVSTFSHECGVDHSDVLHVSTILWYNMLRDSVSL